MFDKEMEIGNLKSIETQDYKLIYLRREELLYVTLADIKLEEKKIYAMLNQLALAFQEDYNRETLSAWSNDITIFYPFVSKMDTIVTNTIAEIFFEQYPSNIVTLTNYINENYTLEYQEAIGKRLAEKILAERFSNVAKKRNLKRELSKFTVVKELTDNYVKLKVCPFCRKKHSTEPICNFVTGFIQGMLKSDNWVESTCVGRGDAACSFVKKN